MPSIPNLKPSLTEKLILCTPFQVTSHCNYWSNNEIGFLNSNYQIIQGPGLIKKKWSLVHISYSSWIFVFIYFLFEQSFLIKTGKYLGNQDKNFVKKGKQLCK